MAVVVAATCMLAACGKQGTVNSQATGESVESVSSEAQESTVSQEEISENGKSKEEKQENAWTDGNTTVEDQDALSLLASLDTDYANVYWGVSYSIFDNLPGLVVSLTPCMQYDSYGLVIGVGADYISELGEGETYDGTVNVYGDKDILALTKGVAMFANPYAAE